MGACLASLHEASEVFLMWWNPTHDLQNRQSYLNRNQNHDNPFNEKPTDGMTYIWETLQDVIQNVGFTF